jgi:4-hydroxybenzoate polyprenyltransferase
MVMDFITFYPVLMLLGAVAVSLAIGTDVIVAAFVNYLLLVFAFLYNDIADREDDKNINHKRLEIFNHIKLNLGLYKKDGFKRFRNPFSRSESNLKWGYLSLTVIAVISASLAVIFNGFNAGIIASTNLAVGIFYSGGWLRLKSRPFVDLISHTILLASLPILYFFTLEDAQITTISWIILSGATTYSIGSALENQYRDYNEDQLAELKNTASFVGRRNAKLLSRIMILVSLPTIVISLLMSLSN